MKIFKRILKTLTVLSLLLALSWAITPAIKNQFFPPQMASIIEVPEPILAKTIEIPIRFKLNALAPSDLALSGLSSLPKHALAPGESIGLPVSLKIPSIAVDAPIIKLALTPDQLMDVPKMPMEAGWYELGPKPGDVGSAVIDGHVDWADDASAVFENLHKVNPGEKILVQDEKGAIISFVVREIRIYDAADDATEVFTSTDGKAHLNLITCDGVWDELAGQYSKRLVVFADKEEVGAI